MDLGTLQSCLSGLPLGQIAYFDVLDSTNEYALNWANGGEEHLSLVVADEQTAGRGRSGRTWFTPPGAALAFSLVLKPELLGAGLITRLTGLGALAVCQVLRDVYGLGSKIKWPNDVLGDGRKLAGVLVDDRTDPGEIGPAGQVVDVEIAGHETDAIGKLAAGDSFPGLLDRVGQVEDGRL